MARKSTYFYLRRYPRRCANLYYLEALHGGCTGDPPLLQRYLGDRQYLVYRENSFYVLCYVCRVEPRRAGIQRCFVEGGAFVKWNNFFCGSYWFLVRSRVLYQITCLCYR